MTTYGIFSSEGLIIGDFNDRGTASNWLTANLDPDEGAYVAEICPYHDEQARESCEDCIAGDSVE